MSSCELQLQLQLRLSATTSFWVQAWIQKSHAMFFRFQELQYRSEISGLRTPKTHAQFLRKHVKNRMPKHVFVPICAHLMRVFPFVIHSRLRHSSSSSLNKRQDKRQF